MIINLVESEKEAQLIFRNLTAVTDRFLPNVSVEYLGYVMSDVNVPKAVRQQKAFMESYPHSKVSRCINQLAQKMVDEKLAIADEDQRSLFWRSAFTMQ